MDPNWGSDKWDLVWNDVLDSGAVAIFKEPTATFTSQFLQSTASGEPTYQGAQLKLSGGDKESFCTWISKFALALMSRLAERFPANDMALMEAMEIFNPSRCPKDRSKLGDYGTAELKVILQHYGTPKASGGTTHVAMIDAEAACLEWALLKQSIYEHVHGADRKNTELNLRNFWRDQINSGELDTLAQMKALVTIRLILPYNTACCERGFSLMGLIKSYLRNRLYIETLDALMTIGMLGTRYVDINNATAFFEEAMDHWETQCMRSPHQARFGNSCARKKRAVDSKTELPLDDYGTSSGCTDQGLDSMADEDELDEAAPATTSAAEEGSVEYADVGCFSMPPNHLLQEAPMDMDAKTLQKAGKFAFKFPEGWETGTFKSVYKATGKAIDTERLGKTCLYFKAFKRYMYVDLKLSEYGCNNMWCTFKPQAKKKKK